jgi:hypothetical protein
MGEFFDVATKEHDGEILWVLICSQGDRQVELECFDDEAEAVETMREAQYRADLWGFSS